MSEDRAKVIRIEFEYEDGTVEFATGDAAEQIKRWYDGCEVMNFIHGAHYSGPTFQKRAAQKPQG